MPEDSTSVVGLTEPFTMDIFHDGRNALRTDVLQQRGSWVPTQ